MATSFSVDFVNSPSVPFPRPAFVRPIPFKGAPSPISHLRQSTSKPLAWGTPSTRTFRCSLSNLAPLVSLPTGLDMEVIQVSPTNRASSSLPPSEQKPPIIFVHGTKHAAWCFSFFQTYFASQNFHTFSISMRGNGNSVLSDTGRPVIGTCNIATYVDDFDAFTAQLPSLTSSSRPPIVVGHSFGGATLQRWAQRLQLQDGTKYHGRLSAMILLASFPPFGAAQQVRRICWDLGVYKAWRIIKALATPALSTDIDLCREVFFSPKDAPGFDDAIEGDRQLQTYMQRFGEGTALVDRSTVKPMEQLDVPFDIPVLSIGGADDVIVDEIAIRESGQFWDGETVLVDGAPHDIMLYSKWRDVAATINEWIENNVPMKDTEDATP